MGTAVSEVNRHGPGSSCGLGEVQQKHVRLVRDQPQGNTLAYVVMSVCMLALRWGWHVMWRWHVNITTCSMLKGHVAASMVLSGR
jgi:hypothetical protein